MIKMQQTMRWFGPKDSVTLKDIRQCGVTHIVTALHEIPVGAVWTQEAITERQKTIRDAGMEWSVIESLPVHESIKRRDKDCELYIKNYKESLKNSAACGLSVVTYNFMPILDWVRTHHNHINDDGTKALLYNRLAFIYFDLYLLKRPNAENDYPDEDKKKAMFYGEKLSKDEKDILFKSVLLGLPGSKINFTATQVLQLLQGYAPISETILRENLIHFLSEVVPVAEEVGVQLAIHPDDPPFSVLGLPRVVCTDEDLQQIFDAVPSTSNGLCYCTGSLGAIPENDLISIIHKFGDRIHFLHLRNVIREKNGVFREAAHLEGDNPIDEIMYHLLLLMNRRKTSIPMRPDHGFEHSIEEGNEHYPGYSLIGRLKGLAELRGLEQGIASQIKIV